MNYNPELHHRRSIRLKGCDYSMSGTYFVTVCSYRKECIFEDIIAASIIKEQWQNLPRKFSYIELDEFVIMPNHIHVILWIKNVGAGLALPIYKSVLPNNKSNTNKGGPRPAPTLGDIVCAFKSKTAVNINRYHNTSGAPVWQRNYYEHIIRNKESLNRIRNYIINNPLKWENDSENPLNRNKEKAKD